MPPTIPPNAPSIHSSVLRQAQPSAARPLRKQQSSSTNALASRPLASFHAASLQDGISPTQRPTTTSSKTSPAPVPETPPATEPACSSQSAHTTPQALSAAAPIPAETESLPRPPAPS